MTGSTEIAGSPTSVREASIENDDHTAQLASSTKERSAISADTALRKVLERFAGERERLRDPKYRDLVLADFEHGFDTRYPGLQRELALTDQELQALIDLLGDQQLRMMEQFGEGLVEEPSDRPAIERLRARQDDDLEQRRREIAELLGPSKHEKWLEYHRSLPVRFRAVSLQAELAAYGAPVDADQSKALLSALLEEQQRLSMGGNPPSAAEAIALEDSEKSLAERQAHDHRVLSELQSALTSDQIAALERILERERQSERAQFEILRQSSLPDATSEDSEP
jgi:hypothetical protein